DLSALVHEGLLPGGTISRGPACGDGSLGVPRQSAAYLDHASNGQNLSGHSTSIQGAFASALAESDGNGAGGVTAWIWRKSRQHQSRGDRATLPPGDLEAELYR